MTHFKDVYEHSPSATFLFRDNLYSSISKKLPRHEDEYTRI